MIRFRTYNVAKVCYVCYNIQNRKDYFESYGRGFNGFSKMSRLRKKVSENAETCPNCGHPNNGDFQTISKPKLPKWIWILLVGFVFVSSSVFLIFAFSRPSITNSPFYSINKKTTYQDIVKQFGSPNDTLELSNYTEYTYDETDFMGIKGEQVFRFGNGDSFLGIGVDPNGLIFSKWIIDGAKYDEKNIEAICDFYDEQYGKRNVQKDGNYEWINIKEDERIWLCKPDYSKGYYEFEYRPW